LLLSDHLSTRVLMKMHGGGDGGCAKLHQYFLSFAPLSFLLLC